MRAGGGQAKGAQFERDICRLLSNWISKGERDDLLWRSNSSGAQWTQQQKKNNRRKSFQSQAGDIISIDPLSEKFMSSVCLEAKFYKDLQMRNLFYGHVSKLKEFWSKHVLLSKEVERVPILVAKENRKPEIILIPDYLEIPMGVLLGTYSIVLLDAFLNTYDYESFQAILDKYQEGSHVGSSRRVKNNSRRGSSNR